MQDNFSIRSWKNEKLYKEEYEGALTTEANTPRYPEGELSVKDKIKAIVPLWKQYSQSEDTSLRDQIKDKISRYTTYDNEYGGGSYAIEILDNSQSIEDVAKIVMKNEKSNTTSQQQYSVELLVPTVYYNVENGELSDNKNEWYTDNELRAGADQTSYTKGSELDDIVFSGDYDQALDFAERYSTLIKVVKDSVQEQDELEDEDIELEIPGEENNAPVGDKKLQAKASRQDVKIKAYKEITAKMKDALEKFKSAEGDAKEAAKEELKALTPEFQAAKKEYEKLKSVKL